MQYIFKPPSKRPLYKNCTLFEQQIQLHSLNTDEVANLLAVSPEKVDAWRHGKKAVSAHMVSQIGLGILMKKLRLFL